MSRYQHMVQEYYVARVREMNRKRAERLKGIKTKRQAVAYQEEARKAINHAFSPRPRKTPLKPKITGELRKDGYRIEKITFESRPDCLVTANLYIPDHIDGKAPGVIGTCGHSMDGKAGRLVRIQNRTFSPNRLPKSIFRLFVSRHGIVTIETEAPDGLRLGVVEINQREDSATVARRVFPPMRQDQRGTRHGLRPKNE